MKIRKNDNVMVIAGNARGKTGKVLKVYPDRERVIVEGVNIIKRHTPPEPEEPAGRHRAARSADPCLERDADRPEDQRGRRASAPRWSRTRRPGRSGACVWQRQPAKCSELTEIDEAGMSDEKQKKAESGRRRKSQAKAKAAQARSGREGRKSKRAEGKGGRTPVGNLHERCRPGADEALQLQERRCRCRGWRRSPSTSASDRRRRIAKLVEAAARDLEAIVGQKVVITRAKKSISNFKLREKMPIGCRVTLRRARHVRVPRPVHQHLGPAYPRLPRPVRQVVRRARQLHDRHQGAHGVPRDRRGQDREGLRHGHHVRDDREDRPGSLRAAEGVRHAVREAAGSSGNAHKA